MFCRTHTKYIFMQAKHFFCVLEHEKKGLQESLNTLQIEEEACSKLQHRIQQLESQISDIQLLLDKEKAKYQSACRQQEVSITAST